jgi:hypothetical protein
MNFRTYLLSLMLSAASLVAGDVQAGYSGQTKDLPQLEHRLAEIDAELRPLARYSLRSGVGPIGFRSDAHTNRVAREWIQIELGNDRPFDQIVLVPAICHDSALGFRADGFPAEFRLLAGKSGDTNGTVLAAFNPGDNLLPRLAPVIIPCPASVASWVRLEATVLSPRAFDGQFNLELAEIMLFDGEENIALRKPLRSSSVSEGPYSKARQLSCVVDGFLPYILHAAEGKPSIAYISPPLQTTRPMLLIDLEAQYPLNRLHLHAVDVDDVFPQSVPYDFCLPKKILIEGADKADFSDARPLTTFQSTSPYDRGPLIILTFPETLCRYVRLSALDPAAQTDEREGLHAIGFAEIELFSKGVNIALGKTFTANFKQPGRARPLAALTDGANFYGAVLPVRRWMAQLARRHDLEQERQWVEKELQQCYARQKVLLQRVS